MTKIIVGVNDLATVNPKLAEEWDYEKNGDLKPTDVPAYSNKKVWWKCKKGHSWLSIVYNRSKGNGCPYCSGRRAIPSETDLATTNSDLAEEWNYEKNGDLKPTDVPAYSNKKVWWLCKKHKHSWKSKINNRSNGNGCPYCSNKKVLQGFNDLVTKNPDLAENWDYEKNENLKPTDVSAISGRKVWWKCKKGHSWEASIANRSKGRGCPFCSNQKIQKGFNDLVTTNPDLAKEWNYDKNGNLKPIDVTAGSKKKVWWKCKKGHSWQTSISHRSKGSGCPYCSGKKVLAGSNDLATTNPKLAKEWDYEKNGDLKPTDVTAHSNKKVWWKCKQHGHSWQATINHRTNGNNCPICDKERKTSFAEQAVFYFIHQYFPDAINGYKFSGQKELDIFIPSKNFAIEYDGHVWHKDFKKDIAKNKVCKDQKIQLIRIREIKNDEEINHDKYKDFDCILFFHHTGDDSELSEIIKQILVLYIGVNPETKIDVDACKQKIHEQYINSEKENSLASKFPEVAKEWDFNKNGNLKPEYVSFGSEKKVWWKCKEHGHPWNAKIADRTKGNGCPYCSNKKVLQGFNDLATTHPEIAQDWNYEKNGDLKPTDVTAGSHKKVWWKCKEHGHSWKAIIDNRSKGNGCPYCSNKKVLQGFNDLATTHPELTGEWDFEKNDNLKPEYVSFGSEKKVWWKCSVCNNGWQASISDRSRGNGCPECSKQKRSKTVICIETNEQFESLTHAAKKYNLMCSKISACCLGKRKTHGGYHWKYAVDVDPDTQE